MKRKIAVALAVALAGVMLFSVVALADGPTEINVEWDIEGPGGIEIYTEKTEGAGGTDYLNVETYGSGSIGSQTMTATPHGYTWCGTDFRVSRSVSVEDGIASAFTVRDNNYSYWGAYTEYSAYVDTSGSGLLNQSYYNTYYYAGMSTYLEANSPYDLGYHEEGSVGGIFEFGIGAIGDGSAELNVSLTDKAEHNGTRLMYGSYGLYADPANAGFDAYGANLLDLQGYLETPTIFTGYNLNTSGYYGIGASADWVGIGGTIDGLR